MSQEARFSRMEPELRKANLMRVTLQGKRSHTMPGFNQTGRLQLGNGLAHGTPFRRAVEEGLLDCKRVVQIGLRGTGYTAEDFDWCRDQGFRVVQVEECWNKSLVPLMAQVREQLGAGPVYISFDIDGIDPAYAPGTGTPEVAGLSVPQRRRTSRSCRTWPTTSRPRSSPTPRR